MLVVALGIALGFLGSYVTALGSHPYGWTGYAPLTQVPYPFESGLHPWVRLLIWLAFTAVWASCSIALLRTSSSSE